uniref:Putative ribonuclease H-like domain-containing protein n=1 Tax=Tanacetum cinerariifolium TaxID=118510 RepID=A0A6L2NHD5_TANCI|nr:putative ribonuclease H-like domain-containing protein [Tanacetum cinerariifolium]
MNYAPVSTGPNSNDFAGKGASFNAGQSSMETGSTSESDNQERPKAESSTKTINIVGPVNTVDYSNDPLMPDLEDVGVFDDAYDDRDEGAEADYNNLEIVISVSPIPFIRIHKDHLKEHIIGEMEPKKVTQALDNESWVEAMQEELLQFKLLNVWTLVDLPLEKRAIRTKWVYRNKRDQRGIVVRNKATLVAQGHIQEESIDYDEVFAPVHVSQPPGFVDPKFPDRVYMVEKALYGLHQAPRAWYETLSTYLLDNGFRRGTIDKTLFIKKIKDDILLVQVYVDDIIFGSTKRSLSTELEQLMHKRFQMSFMGELTFFLGLQVEQRKEGIFLSQDKYVSDILKKFGFSSVKSASTPMERHKPLSKDATGTDVDVHLYGSMIGSLMYLTSFRPDIMFFVCACSRFQVQPKVSHMHAVKIIFRYLKGQPTLGLWYPKDSPLELIVYSDSDYAGASLDRKSTIGGSQFLGSRLISWQCKKQTIVANFTTEAEYIAASNCCGQVLWLQNQLLDYGYNFMQIKIHVDNESAICVVKKHVYHSKTKHIEIRHHFIRDSYEKRLIEMVKIHTDYNVPDLHTKAFDVTRFQFLVTSIGLELKGYLINDGYADLVQHVGAGQTATSKELSNLLMAGSLSKTTLLTKLVKTVNDEVRIQALVDGKRVNIKESSIRRILRLDNVEVPKPHHGTSSATLWHLPSFVSLQIRNSISQAEHNLPSPSHDPLPGGEDSLKLKELMDFCTNLSNKVLDLESEVIDIKSTYKAMIEKLESRVEMLKEENRVLKELKGVHSTVDSDEPVMEKEESSKQGRKIADIDVDVEINLEKAQAEAYNLDLDHQEKVLSMLDDNDEEPVDVEEVLEVVKAVKLITEVITTAGVDVNAASVQDTPITVAEATKVIVPRKKRGVIIQDPEETTTTITVQPKVQAKNKEKAILIEEPKPLKRKMKIDLDEEVARQLEAELNADINWNAMIEQVKRSEKLTDAVMKYQALKKKPLTEAQARRNMIVYLKNMAGYKMNYFKGMSYDEIRPLFEKHYNYNRSFLNEIPIIDYKIYTERNRPYFKIIRADGNHSLFLSFSTMLKNFDREDLESFWNIVRERFAKTEPKNYSNDFLLNTLKIMFEKPNVEANV